MGKKGGTNLSQVSASQKWIHRHTQRRGWKDTGSTRYIRGGMWERDEERKRVVGGLG